MRRCRVAPPTSSSARWCGCRRRWPTAGLRSRLLLQVHDELLFEAPEGEVAALTALAKRVMESAAMLSVPLVVETGSGRTWADAH